MTVSVEPTFYKVRLRPKIADQREMHCCCKRGIMLEGASMWFVVVHCDSDVCLVMLEEANLRSICRDVSYGPKAYQNHISGENQS